MLKALTVPQLKPIKTHCKHKFQMKAFTLDQTWHNLCLTWALKSGVNRIRTLAWTRQIKKNMKAFNKSQSNYQIKKKVRYLIILQKETKIQITKNPPTFPLRLLDCNLFRLNLKNHILKYRRLSLKKAGSQKLSSWQMRKHA